MASCGHDGTSDIRTRCVLRCDLCVVSCWNFGVVLGHTVMATRHSSFCLGCCVSYLLGLIMEAVFQVAEVKDRRPSSLPIITRLSLPSPLLTPFVCLSLVFEMRGKVHFVWRPTS